MKSKEEIKLEDFFDNSTDIKNLNNWPPNIRRFDYGHGSLLIAINQHGAAISMVFVPRTNL